MTPYHTIATCTVRIPEISLDCLTAITTGPMASTTKPITSTIPPREKSAMIAGWKNLVILQVHIKT